jgi:UDP-2-acetamido-2-deoxy-ribo-hexuluronate aminotransferase
MQFIDLAFQQGRIREKIEAKVKAVFDHGQYILGPEVKELEERLAAYVGVKHAIACSSGTDALLMALMAHSVGPGDVIFTTPFTFIATAEVIRLLGATPVFVDIDPRTYNIAPEALDRAIRAVKSSNPSFHPLPRFDSASPLVHPAVAAKGIIAVDLYGLPADYEGINAVAQEHELFVIEDAAQSFGAEIRGVKSGALASIGCTSFFPAKPLGCYGDGGMCFSDDDALAMLMRSISLHGQGRDRYQNIRLGINGRMDTLQAAILLAKFEIFQEEVELRQDVAGVYTDLIASSSSLVVPYIPENCKSVWAQYTVRSRDDAHRRMLQSRLKEAKIPTAIYYPKPLHLQDAFVGLGYEAGDLPVSEDYASRVFSLPMHPYLKLEDLQSIACHLTDADE